MPIIDTNFLIQLAHDDGPTVRALAKLHDVPLIVPSQAAAEYLAGLSRLDGEIEGLRDSFEIAHTDDEHTLAMARLGAASRAAGTRPHWADIHIAAHAVLRATYVITANERHFRQLGVPTWNWTREEQPPR